MNAGASARRILLVDNHEVMRRGIRVLVEMRANWQIVAEASDGHTALELARAVKPDVVIADYTLPISNGLELTRQLKLAFPDVEILFYTMQDREDLIAEVVRAGAKGYVLKADDAAELVAALEALSVRRPYFSSSISGQLVSGRPRPTLPKAPSVLTQREREVVRLVAEGRMNKEVAELLSISVKTAEAHRASTMQKLNIKTTADLVRYAVRNNIVDP